MKIPAAYVGKWQIIQMDQWDRNFIDLVKPGQFAVGKDGLGSFRFGAVQGQMDCIIDRTGSREKLDFSWVGTDECDSASGRGWVQVDGKRMIGHIFFHLGENSTFRAEKAG